MPAREGVDCPGFRYRRQRFRQSSNAFTLLGIKVWAGVQGGYSELVAVAAVESFRKTKPGTADLSVAIASRGG